MKKLLILILSLVTVFALASCGGKDTPSKTKDETTLKTDEPNHPIETEETKNPDKTYEPTLPLEPVDPFWDKDNNGIADWQEEEVTITYATWQHFTPDVETIDSLMVKAFEEKYPNIHVEMQIVGEDFEWDNNMIALLESNNLPDVFLVNRLENFLPYGILGDITDMFDHDEDTNYIFDSIKNLGLYRDKRYVIPTFIYPNFWIVNKDVLSNANVTIPSYDWTWEQMEEIAKACNNDTDHTIGVYGTEQYFYEYPKVIEEKTNPGSGLYAYGFNGDSFDYMSDSYLTAMNNMEKAIGDKYVINALPPEKLLEYYGDETLDPRYAGHVAIWNEPSWSAKNHMPEFEFDYDIYPAPSGIGMGNTDIAGISNLTDHPEAAYQLLKWMTYSEEGVLKRFEIYREYGSELYFTGNNYPYPIVDYGYNADGYNLIWENIPYGDTAPGLVAPEFIEALRHAAIRANKEVIGWDAVYGAVGYYFDQILNGQASFASVREAIQQAADQALALQREQIDAQLG